MAAILRVTRRCALEDLGCAEEDLGKSVEELAESNSVLASFVAKRSQNPEGQETVQDLTSRIVAYSLHSGVNRGITWHDRNRDVVWLLAARLHRSGKSDDAYPYFVALDRAGTLMPAREDLVDLVASQRVSFAKALMENVPPLRDRALEERGSIQDAVIAGRAPVRFAVEEGDPPVATVAISLFLLPGPVQMPPGWQLVIAAAFLPANTAPEDLSFTSEIAGEPLRDDEVGYCNFIEDDPD